jgi:hypothetical protein
MLPRARQLETHAWASHADPDHLRTKGHSLGSAAALFGEIRSRVIDQDCVRISFAAKVKK